MWPAAAALAAIVLFALTLHGFGVIRVAQGALVSARSALAVMADSTLADDDKEVAIQQTAIALLGSAAGIVVRSLACLAASAVPIYAVAVAGLGSTGDAFGFLARWDVIVVSSLVIGGLMYRVARRPPSESAYSAMDRAVHGLAFSRPFVQLTAADLEDSMFGRDIEAVKDRPPLFVTSLPRAGTTVLLEALATVPGLATHRYRDMPFVMAPLLWSRLSGPFARPGGVRERAHGDGIEVGYDSPEAFEEVLWRTFWPGKYHGDRIELWQAADSDPEVADFFRRHFRKIVALRCAGQGRYVSKNNANIARLELLPRMFPGATVVVPVREPLEHAASLLRQHENFLDRHARDPFVKRYMEDIGHLEFGALHRPFGFDGFAALAAGLTPRDPDYWLAYWIAGNRTVLAHAAGLLVLPQDRLAGAPQPVMDALCRTIGVEPQDFSGRFRAVAKQADAGRYDPGLVGEAGRVYAALQARADDWMGTGRR